MNKVPYDHTQTGRYAHIHKSWVLLAQEECTQFQAAQGAEVGRKSGK